MCIAIGLITLIDDAEYSARLRMNASFKTSNLMYRYKLLKQIKPTEYKLVPASPASDLDSAPDSNL